MEGKNNQKLAKNKLLIFSAIVVIFHAVGLFGFLYSPWVELFKLLVPFHLLLMLLMLILSGYDGSRSIGIFAVVIFSAGFLVEMAGVNTGVIFGEYKYGSTLGIKLVNTPLMIGVNWLILVYSAGVFLKRFAIKSNLISALLSACILVAIDFFIEPVAIHFDYWSWQEGEIPLQNYIGWFLFAFLLSYLFAISDFRKHNPVAVVLFIVQSLFFIALNVWAF